MITLRLLGPVEATLDGGAPPPELLWRKHLALLAYLAVAPERRAGREQLTGLLWPEKPEAAARHSLAEALRILRKCTGERVQDAGSGYVRLSDGAVETDIDRFQDHLEAGDLTAAAALVVGEFMEGFALSDAWELEEWLAHQRRAWRSRSEDALLGAAEEVLDGGDPAEAYELARRTLMLVPASDRACQLAMRSLCLRGERGLALEAYAEFSHWLDRELGIRPDEETAGLADRVRSQRSWRLPAARTRVRRGAETRRAPLVGRGLALAPLVHAWEECRAGDGARAAVILGDAGTGRSRLLHELLERARLDGGDVAVVRAMAADRAETGSVLTALGREAGFDPGAGGAALAEQVEGVDPRTPLVLAVDDADGADARSLDELSALVSRAASAPLLVALTAARATRRDAIDRLAAEVGRGVPGALVTLDPLGPEPLRELAGWAMPDYDDTALERLARRLAADTAGYPLLAVELLHAVAHGLSLEEGSVAWPAPGRTLDQTRPGDLPETLVSAVRVGFRVLSEPAQRTLAAVAVMEPPASPAAIEAATGLEGPVVEEALDELEWERWLGVDARGYAFLARLVRDIIARDMITPGQRRRILEAVRAQADD